MSSLSRAVSVFKHNEKQRLKRVNETLEESYARRTGRLKKKRNVEHALLSVGDNFTDVEELNFGTMNEICNFCGALFWEKEKNSSGKFTKCCHNGKVLLQNLTNIPALLKVLLTEDTVEAKNYRQHIREYNAALAFASMGAEIKPPAGIGPYCFRIHGQIYHMVSPLYTSAQKTAGYGQLYIFDSSEATDQRMIKNSECFRSTMERLDFLLREINPFAQSYIQMHQLTACNPAADVKLIFLENPDADLRRYNAPTTRTEVAAIFVGDDGEPPANRDICVYPVGEHCQRMSPMNQCVDPMVYPLLFPRGECGWHSGMKHVEERRTAKRIQVTQLQYYAYRLAVRGEFSLLHNSGKLFQQYIVDAYVKTEGSRLNYLRLNQKNLRIEMYQGLIDALHTEASNNDLRLGKLIILPSSFQGSPRYMQQNYQDAMAIVRKFGRPDLFVTFTCNPTWPEISNSLEERQRPENRPDIIVRVFKMKLSELLTDILQKNVLGVVIAHIYVIEFQKRGLPHAHMLLTLDSRSKIRTKDDIDKFVTAELPCKNANPRLYDIVTKCMIHGPCGTLNSNSPCMKDGSCSKGYPKEFRETTAENVNGYPLYRRRAQDPIKVGKYDLDNRWVVPYNPFLTKKYNAHINVEVCASVKSVKYLYKYVYKGHDAASIKLQFDNGFVNHDEISTFLDGRYVSAPEAMWRLNEFFISEKSHAIQRLAVHLPDHQLIVYHDGQEAEAVARASVKCTTLTAWFELNKVDEEAHIYTYSDVPQYYVFDKNRTVWKRRQRGGQQIIGRMPIVNIQDSERYYLRMLLLRKPGAISFEDLKTVNGVICQSFQHACRELGLLEGDKHWHDTLYEASQTKMPHHLRLLFVVICGFGEVEDISKLWTQHRDVLCEDFVQRYSQETGIQCALSEINELLKTYGLNLKKIKLPEVYLPETVKNLPLYDIFQEESKGRLNIEKLNSQQKVVVEKVLSAIYEEMMPKLFFLDGPAGTGKTFIYTTLLHIIRGKGDQVVPVASTGIAATLLSGGRTAHATFKIPLILNATSTCNLKRNTSEARLLLDAKLIVWDEAPMTHIHAFLAVDRLLQDITHCSEPFGGKVVLLGGDFRQVLPVIPRGSRALTIASCLKKHTLWSKFHILYLHENMRTLPQERDFAKWLLEVGEGKQGEILKIPTVCYPELQDPIKQLYGDLDLATVTPDQLKGRAILTVTNDSSMDFNNQVLDSMPGDEVVYVSTDTILSDDPHDQLAYPEEFLNSLTPTGMPPHKLKLKAGAVIMLLRNLLPSKGLCNGTRLLVTKLQKNVIESQLIDADDKETFFIPRIPLIPSDNNMPFSFKRKQFPVRLSYSMTINKSQGQTFEKLCLVLSKPVFSHGQLYVGLSRVRSFESVAVIAPSPEIYNCVYKEVLN